MQRDGSFTILEKNIQQLAIETFKVKHDLESEVFESMFVINNNSTQLCLKHDFHVPKIKTEHIRKNSVRYLGSIIWNSLPQEIKSIATFFNFEVSIKTWKPDCPS